MQFKNNKNEKAMIYTKTIAGRQVFSDCKTIQLEFDHDNLVAGQYVSNPLAELIYAEGWREYVPPVLPQAEPEMDEMMQAVKKMLASSTEELSDEDALAVAALFPTWHRKIGLQVNIGERLWYDGKLYKVVQQHTAQADWKPDATPALYTEVSIEEWPEILNPIPSTNPYMTGDKVTFNGQHYICQLDNCVWSPEELPSAWRLVA